MANVVLRGDPGGAAGALDVLVRSGVRLARVGELHRTRLDTFDGRLHARGLRLELRTTSVTRELVLSGEDGPSAVLTIPDVPGRSDDAPPRLDLDALPPGPLTSRVRDAAGIRALLPQVGLRSRRRSGWLADPTGPPRVHVHLDLDLDLVGSEPAVAALPAWTLEVVELPGHTRAANMLRARITASLEGAGGGPTPWTPGDALELATDAAGVDRAGWQGPPPAELHRDGPAIVGVRSVLRGFADTVDANWQGVVEDLDPEFLHDLRIAVRQTRSLLTNAANVLPRRVRADGREIYAWLGDLTSPARDLDVCVQGWDALTSLVDAADADALAPVHAHLEAQRAAEHLELTRQLTSPTAAALHTRARAWLDLPDDEVEGGQLAEETLGVVLGRRLHDAHERVREGGRAIDADSPPTALHELRKDAKQLSYLLSGFGLLGGRRRVREVLRPLRLLQDNLGAHQDAEVQTARLRGVLEEMAADAARGGPALPRATQDAAERLGAALAARKLAERTAFEERFEAFERKKVRRALDEIIQRMSR